MAMASMSSARFGPLHLVDVGELEPAGHQVPQAHARRRPVGGSTRTGPKRAWPSSKTRVGTPNPPLDTTRSCSACTSSPVVGSAMAARTMPGIEPHLGQEGLGHIGTVGLAALLVQGPARHPVPAVEQVRVLAPEVGADPHHRPAVGPLPLPGVLLALGPVDLLEAEEPPPDLEAEPVPAPPASTATSGRRRGT